MKINKNKLLNLVNDIMLWIVSFIFILLNMKYAQWENAFDFPWWFFIHVH
jgi:succinate dehydrogenase hydrophobic anchor subunit